MLSFGKSDNLLAKSEFNNEPIYLFQQFFIHKDNWRQENEIKFCVKKNNRTKLRHHASVVLHHSQASIAFVIR